MAGIRSAYTNEWQSDSWTTDGVDAIILYRSYWNATISYGCLFCNVCKGMQNYRSIVPFDWMQSLTQRWRIIMTYTSHTAFAVQSNGFIYPITSTVVCRHFRDIHQRRGDIFLYRLSPLRVIIYFLVTCAVNEAHFAANMNTWGRGSIAVQTIVPIATFVQLRRIRWNNAGPTW